jgi:hypothetical protein
MSHWAHTSQAYVPAGVQFNLSFGAVSGDQGFLL